MNELPQIGRDPIPSHALSDEQTQVLDILRQEDENIRAAFNQVLREKGLDLEVLQFSLGPGPSETDRPALVRGGGYLDPTAGPPPGVCWCSNGGAPYCC